MVWACLKFSTVAVGLSSSLYIVNSALEKCKQTEQNQTKN